jgi:hypothetical protein
MNLADLCSELEEHYSCHNISRAPLRRIMVLMWKSDLKISCFLTWISRRKGPQNTGIFFASDERSRKMASHDDKGFSVFVMGTRWLQSCWSHCFAAS